MKKTFVCDSCNCSFNYPNYTIDGRYGEMLTCPVCGSDDVRESNACVMCGAPTDYKLCDCCFGSIPAEILRSYILELDYSDFEDYIEELGDFKNGKN